MKSLKRIEMFGDTRLIPPADWCRSRSVWPGTVLVWIIFGIFGIYNPVCLAEVNHSSIDNAVRPMYPNCHARCTAKCEDTVAGITPHEWNIPEELLIQISVPDEILESDSHVCSIYYCTTYLNDEWVEYCDGDSGCVESCLNLTSTNVDVAEPPGEPTELRLLQQTAYTLTLSWQPSNAVSLHSVVYLVQKNLLDPQNWITVNTTSSLSTTVLVGVCEHWRYRVSAFNQYGTQGPATEVVRSDLPHPGPVSYLRSNIALLPTDTFLYRGIFDLPEGWGSADIGHLEVKHPMIPHCKFNFLPPIPQSAEFVEGPGLRQATLEVYIHESAYDCLYFTEVRAVSSCGLPGQYYNVTMDFQDCDNILNLSCPTPPYQKPGNVYNVTTTVTEGSCEVTIGWEPPLFGGSEGVSGYVVQWGPIYASSTSPILKVHQEGRSNVPANITWLEVCVDLVDVSYGVKVAAVDVKGYELVNETLRQLPLIKTFRVSEEEVEPQDKSRMIYVVVAVVTSVVLAASLIAAITYVRNKKRSKKRGASEPFSLSSAVSTNTASPALRNIVQNCMVNNPFYESLEGVTPLVIPDEWEIPLHALKLGDVLGRGAFGQVVHGILRVSGLKIPCMQRGSPALLLPPCEHEDNPNEKVVAVKMLHEFAGENQHQDFLREMALMKQIGNHLNIVSMIGCCTQGEPLCLVVEHLPNGDLLHHLRRYRHRLQNPHTTDSVESTDDLHLTLQDLLSSARQVAVGMEYLSQKGFVHRDLATRNVMVGDHGLVKIGDFGLTRYIYTDQLYVAGKGARLPIKWMAIESIEEYKFTTETDVWAFGVLLFELVTLGGTPYPTIHNRHLVRELKRGYRMECPDNCTPQLYQVMCDCWKACPSDRATFSDLRHRLEVMMTEVISAEYLDLSLDVTRDYYQISASSASSGSDGELEIRMEDEREYTTAHIRSPSESTRADSGVGDNPSSTASQPSLPTGSGLSLCTSSILSNPDSVLDVPDTSHHDNQSTSSNNWAGRDLVADPMGSPDNIPGIDLRSTVSKEARTATGGTKPKTDPRSRSRTSKGRNTSQHNRTHQSSTKVKRAQMSSSLPILFQLQKPHRHGDQSRVSATSTDQLIPGYSGSSSSTDTTDSGSHSWMGETIV